jgi:hypothetical protein
VKLGLSVEKLRLGMVDSRRLKRIFGPKRQEVSGEIWTQKVFVICMNKLIQVMKQRQ